MLLQSNRPPAVQVNAPVNPATAREAMLEAIRSGSGAGKLKRVKIKNKQELSLLTPLWVFVDVSVSTLCFKNTLKLHGRLKGLFETIILIDQDYFS